MDIIAVIIALIVPIGVAKIACENVGHNVSEHFPDVRKTIAMPKSAEKEIDDYLLTRYACYLVALTFPHKIGKKVIIIPHKIGKTFGSSS